MCLLRIIVVMVVIYVVVIITIDIGIGAIITHVVVGLMVFSSVELIAFVIVFVGMPIAVSSHGRVALTMVILGLTLTGTTDHSLLELGCHTCARRVSDGVALLAHMKLTVGGLLSMTNYLAELAEIRAVLGAMTIVTTMSADHMHRLCKDAVAFSKSFSLLLVSFRFAGPCPPRQAQWM